MKLSTIAVSVIVGLGVVVTGGSWYSGKQFEQYSSKLPAEINEQLALLKSIYDIDAKVKNIKLDRHLFSSDISYEIETITMDKTDVFQGKGTVYHGPLPLNQVVKGNLIPTAVSIETNVIAPERLKEIFSSLDFLSTTFNIGYQESISGNIVVKPYHITNALNIEQKADGITSDFKIDKSGNGYAEIHTPLLNSSNSKSNQRIDLEQANIHLNWEKKSDYPYLANFDVGVKAKSYKVSPINPMENSIKVGFSDVNYTADSKLNKNVYDSTGKMSAKLDIASQNSQQSFGLLKLDTFSSFDAKAINELVAYIIGNKTLAPENMLVLSKTVMERPLKIHINNFSLENEKGKNELALILNSDNLESDVQKFNQIIKLFKQSSFSMKLNISALEQLLTQLYSLHPKSNGTPEIIAKEKLNELLYNAKASELAVVDPENIQVTLEIDGGKVKLNGKEVPEKKVEMAIVMIMFGLSGMGK
ncbi:hypothetical protein A6B43_01085 [Vespertiliibacter pulmonis]|uniref:Uncharacterized protein YdgA (DUF945 family) n=1 Tax=Vespertiliibacter pulmonis TaxID=1443036 RepID=A0A3N4WJU4_9PAST|nr:DUF945 family protein [Vespertiliibacter pulmonis]QLB20232.1 hypothetical protein A6B43_01085 [Vespertiliibacter pulmonis]RPE86210.1 uncharacterized protein YdgA (DUF945 family) [Vespertiliibacter pulmonis]